MDTLRLQPSDMIRLMEKLATNFGGKRDLAAKADLWYDRLQKFPLAVVEQVVDQLLAEDRQYFPQVGRALALARAQAPDIASPAKIQMRQWEDDPWAGKRHLEADTPDFNAWKADDLPSDPCPVCGECIRFSPRGPQIEHLDYPHTVARVSYSNEGKKEWWEIGPLPELPARKNLAATPVRALLPASIP
jgi:hypothetical protein